MHVEAEKLMCPFGGDCITYLCPFDGDCIAYQSLTLLIGKSFAEQEQQKDVGSVPSRLGDALLMNDIKYAVVTREDNEI